jgi:N-carbamoylputrescine amidase
MKVAAVQYAPVFRAVEANRNTAVKMVHLAAEAGAQLIVLPELCLTGYSFMNKLAAAPFAEVVPESPAFVGFQELSSALDVAIAWGFMEKDPGTGKLYNAQALVLPEGQYATYRKINRWGQDMIWAEAGTASPPIVDYLGKKVGLLICRDVRDKAPEWDDFYEPGDADIVVFSTNWGDGGYPSVNWHRFATNNEVWLVVANRYGQELNNNFGEGGPCIISPEGEVYCDGLAWNKPCIVYGEVP